MSVKIAEQGQLVFAPVSTIWEALYQVDHWGRWVTSVHRVEMLETPKPDAIGRILPEIGAPYHFRFLRVNRDEMIQWERPFVLGTKLIESCSLVRNVEGAIVMCERWCEGGLERQVGFLMKRRLARDLVHQSIRLKRLSEKLNLERDEPKLRVSAL